MSGRKKSQDQILPATNNPSNKRKAPRIKRRSLSPWRNLLDNITQQTELQHSYRNWAKIVVYASCKFCLRYFRQTEPSTRGHGHTWLDELILSLQKTATVKCNEPERWSPRYINAPHTHWRSSGTSLVRDRQELKSLWSSWNFFCRHICEGNLLLWKEESLIKLAAGTDTIGKRDFCT